MDIQEMIEAGLSAIGIAAVLARFTPDPPRSRKVLRGLKMILDALAQNGGHAKNAEADKKDAS